MECLLRSLGAARALDGVFGQRAFGRGAARASRRKETPTDDLFDRLDPSHPGDPTRGVIRWSPGKSLWWSSAFLLWLVVGALHFSWSAVGVFVFLSGLTLCLGHSIGMHRKLIHQSFRCAPATERVLVYLGTLVGLGGPQTMMRTHDMRDWAQRQPVCHDFLSHGRSVFLDFWWQLHCKLHLADPPAYAPPDRVRQDRFYRLLDRTAMAQQLPIALLLYAFGGWGWVAWGVCGRVAASIFGHWIVGYYAHNRGQRDWHVHGAAVQGHNLPGLGLITFGECWHNNHHAFPGSARLGLKANQFDPGWLVLRMLRRVGLVWALNEPAHLPRRPELLRRSS